MKYLLGAGVLATIFGVALAASADSIGTTYVHKGKEVTKFEAMKILLASNNKENILKCSEQYMDERRGTLKNK